MIRSDGSKSREIDRILRLKDVCEATGLAKSTIYGLVQRGEFPKQVKLTTRSSGWFQSEVRDWIEDLRTKRDG